MKELFEYSFSGINLIPTVLLIFSLLYWLVVLLGFVNMGSFDVDTDIDLDADIDVHADVDLDVHADVDVDAHADIDTDIDAGAHGPSFAIQALDFFNIGKVPFMVLLSLVALPLWIIALVVNHYSLNSSIIISLVLLIPEFIFSLFIAKFFSSQIARVFSKIDEETGRPEDFTGRIAKVRVYVEKDSLGQVEFVRNDTTVLLNARSVESKIPEGEQVLIIDFIEKENYYIVEPYK